MVHRSIMPLLISALTLNACATTQYYWQHSQLTGQGAEQQLVVDRGACTAEAYRAIGPPPAPPGASGTVTDFSGTTSSGVYVTGQARTTGQTLGWGAGGVQQANMENQYQTALNQ